MAGVTDYTVLDWFCVLTAVLAPVPTLIGAIKNWKRSELGAGDRRPEPTIVALVANASWLFFGCTERLLEPFGLNAWGGAIQSLALVVFLKLRTGDEWDDVLAISGLFSAIHFVSLVPIGLSHLQLMVYQTLCTIAGMLAAAAPLLTFLFLHENKTVDLLPKFWLLCFNTVHGLVWSFRGCQLNNMYMLAQNGTGVLCSVFQLMIVRRLTHRNLRIQQAQDLREWLLSGLPVPVPQPQSEEMPPLEEIPPALPQETQDMVPAPRHRAPAVRRSQRLAAAAAAANQ